MKVCKYQQGFSIRSWLVAVFVLSSVLVVVSTGSERVETKQLKKGSISVKPPISSRKLREVSSTGSPASQNGQSDAKEFLPWLDLEMTLPPQEEGSHESHEVSELSLELRFDDDTPPSKVTIVDPNITWSGEGKQQITIRPTEHYHHEEQLNTLNKGDNFASPSSTILPLTNNKMEEMEMVMVKGPVSPGKSEVCNCPDIEEIIDAVLHANILKGTKGDKGDRGMNGIPGLSIQGQKGEPGGDPIGIRPHHSMMGQVSSGGGVQGERGPQGPPGVCNPKDCGGIGAPNANKWTQPTAQKPSVVPPENLYKIVPGALVFPTRRAMLQMQAHSFIGTVAFVEEEELFYGRVKGGWKSFTMGSRVHRLILSTPNYNVPLPPPTEVRSTQVKPVISSPSQQSVFDWKKRPASADVTNTKPGMIPSSQIDPHSSSSSLQSSTLTRRTRLSQTSHNSETWERHPSKKNGGVLDKTPLMSSRIVALNSPLSGDMGGHNQVNYQCQRQAMKTHLYGVFRALHILPREFLRISTAKSTTFVNWKNESLRILAPKLYSFNGKEVDGARFAWTYPPLKSGSIGIGARKKQNCRGWTSDSSHETGITASISDYSIRHDNNLFVPMNDSLLSSTSCDKAHIVLCVEFLHMNQLNVRHIRNDKGARVRLSFDKYLAILKNYDDNGGIS